MPDASSPTPTAPAPAGALWRPVSGWSAFAQSGRFGRATGAPGVHLVPLERRPLATLILRQGQDTALAAAVRARLALDLPEPGRVSFDGSGDLVWSAPGQWLAVGAPCASFADLPALLDGRAAVTDQSDARALVAIGGPDARDMLAKGLAIDLHPSVFASGSAAVTSLDHVGIQIWQVDAAPLFRLAVPRSYAGSLWSWLMAASAEFGCAVG